MSESPFDKMLGAGGSSRVDGDGTPGSTLGPGCIIPGVTKVGPPDGIPGGTRYVYYREPQPPPGYRPVLRMFTMVSRDDPGPTYTDASAPSWFAALVDPADMLEVAPDLAGSSTAELLAAVRTRLSADVLVDLGAGLSATVRRDNFGIGFYPPPSKAGRWWGLLASASGGTATSTSRITVGWEYRLVTGLEVS